MTASSGPQCRLLLSPLPASSFDRMPSRRPGETGIVIHHADLGDLLVLLTFNMAYDTGIFPLEPHRVQLLGCYCSSHILEPGQPRSYTTRRRGLKKGLRKSSLAQKPSFARSIAKAEWTTKKMRTTRRKTRILGCSKTYSRKRPWVADVPRRSATARRKHGSRNLSPAGSMVQSLQKTKLFNTTN